MLHIGKLGNHLRQAIGGVVEEGVVPHHLGVIRVERQVLDTGLHEVVEEVSPEAHVRKI